MLRRKLQSYIQTTFHFVCTMNIQYKILPILSLYILFLISCTTPNGDIVQNKEGKWELAPLSEIEKRGDISIENKFPPYNNFPISSEAKIFLVAAGNDSANFIQEVEEQKNIWIQKGYRSAEIVCYYSKPPREVYSKDKTQFQNLAPSLNQWYEASIPLIQRHIKQVSSQKPNPDFIYIYLTSHGLKPKFTWSELQSEDTNESLEKYFSQKHPYLDEHQIYFGQDNGNTTSMRMKLHEIENGRNPHDLILNPDGLRNMLSPASEIPKIVAIQACYSGGFIKNKASLTTLAKLPNIQILTASRYDRSSFGCNPGNKVTLFGEVYNHVILSKIIDGIPDTDWKNIHSELIKWVDKKEESYKINDSKKSLPEYYKN